MNDLLVAQTVAAVKADGGSLNDVVARIFPDIDRSTEEGEKEFAEAKARIQSRVNVLRKNLREQCLRENIPLSHVEEVLPMFRDRRGTSEYDNAGAVSSLMDLIRRVDTTSAPAAPAGS